MLKLLRKKSAAPTLPPGPPGGDGASASGLPNPHFGQPDEMPFLDHLEELRWRILIGLGAILACSALCLLFADWVIDDVLLAPTKTGFFMYDAFGIDPEAIVLQNRTITGQFFAYIGTVIAVGVLMGLPVVLYQAWAFVQPGLYDHERKGLRFSAVFATAFFVLGASFGYLVLTPLALQFFAGFQISDTIVNEFDISRYFSMVLTWCFGTAILFELPVVVYFLASLGVVTAAILRAIRKYALVVILILAAFFTPPDPMSQMIVAAPLLLLYEGSIWLTAIVERRRAKAERKAALKEAKKNPPPPPAQPTEPPSETVSR
jgi:sec-independent protein translocase protein TatC